MNEENTRCKETREAYVVCIDKQYIRDAQRFDTSEISDKEFETLDKNDYKYDECWRDAGGHLFVDVVFASSPDEAKVIAGNKHWLDARQLVTTKVQTTATRMGELYAAMLDHISELVSGADLFLTLTAIGFTREEIAAEGYLADDCEDDNV